MIKLAIKAVGFEGSFPTAGEVSWGAAALSVEDRIINPRTGVSVAALDDLAGEEFLTLFTNPVPLKNVKKPTKALVAVFKSGGKIAEVAKGDTKQAVHIGAGETNGFDVLVFEDDTAFEIFADFRAEAIAREILIGLSTSTNALGERDRQLLKAGLTLVPHHPTLHAIQTAYAGEDDVAYFEEVAEATLSASDRPSGVDEFRRTLRGLRVDSPTYEIKYEGGTADDGFDIAATVRVLKSLDDVFSFAEPANFSALLPARKHEDQRPVITFQKAASVSFRLDAPEPQNVLDRLRWATRFEELSRVIEQGKSNADESRALHNALAALLSADLSKSVEQKVALGEFARIDPSNPSRLPAKRLPLESLAYVSGVLRDGEAIQLRFPFVRTVKVVNTDTGRSNRSPVGVRFADAKSWLFTSVFVRMDLVHEKRVIWEVKQLEKLSDGGTWLVTGFPSSLMRGEFAHQMSVKCEVRGNGGLRVGQHLVEQPLPKTQPAAARWCDSLCETLARIEADLLKDRGSDLRYFPRTPEFTLLDDIVCLLAGGRLTTQELTSAVQAQSALARRNNNIVKEIRNAGGLFDRTQRGSHELSPKGDAKAAALKRIGWRAADPNRSSRSSQ